MTPIKYPSHVFRLRTVPEYWHLLGPGLTTGAADDDPSSIATYSQTGAIYGFQLLWLAGFTFPLMAVAQEMCARIGLVTERGLAANIRLHFPAPVLYVCTLLLVAANTVTIGADLGAMAKATQLVLPSLPFWVLLAIFGSLITSLLIYSSYRRYSQILKILALALLSYLLSAVLSHLDWRQVALHTFIPQTDFSKDQLILICGILGNVLSPYMFFWQTAQEVEERQSAGPAKEVSDEDIKKMRVGVWSGMAFSNLIMYFVIATCAGVLHAHGITNISSLADAAQALRPFAGNATYLLFTLGIIGGGMLAVPVLAGSSAYALSESFDAPNGLNRTLRTAPLFYGIVITSMLAGLTMNFLGIDPVRSLTYSAIANGFVAPVILATIVLLSSSKAVMGTRKSGPWVTRIGWIISAILGISAIAALYAFFS